VGIRGRDVRDDPLLAGMRTSAASTIALATHEPPARDPLATVAVTAEIPPVPVTASRLPAVAVADSPVTRLPAPVPLRQTVWFLFFVLLLCGAGLWGLHARPSWFAFLRSEVGPAVPVATQSTGSATPGSSSKGGATSRASTGPAGFRLAATTSVAGFVRDTYTTGTTDYTVTVTTTALCWVVMKSPSNAAGDLVEATEPAGFHETLPATGGSFFVEVAAHGATITVSSNGKVLGLLPDAHVGDYTFRS
jgi:hypothetical protein